MACLPGNRRRDHGAAVPRVGTNVPLRRSQGDPRIRAQPIHEATMLSTVLLIVLILLLVGAMPSWGYSRNWGYGPSGILGIVLVVVLVLALTGRV
jgi:hypothetical protein